MKRRGSQKTPPFHFIQARPGCARMPLLSNTQTSETVPSADWLCRAGQILQMTECDLQSASMGVRG